MDKSLLALVIAQVAPAQLQSLNVTISEFKTEFGNAAIKINDMDANVQTLVDVAPEMAIQVKSLHSQFSQVPGQLGMILEQLNRIISSLLEWEGVTAMVSTDDAKRPFFLGLDGGGKQGMAISDVERAFALPSKSEMTRLHKASQKGQIKLVEHLLSMNEPVDAIDDNGRIPLHSAAEFRHGEVVYILLKYGSKPDTKDHAGWTPRDAASDPTVIWLLKNGPSHNPTDLKGDTFLHATIKSSSVTAADTIEWALNRGYSIDYRDSEDDIPLSYGVGSGGREITQLLINYGAQVNTETDGYPLLVLAACKGYYSIVKVLIDHGAAIDDPGSTRRMTALLAASDAGRDRVVQLLSSRDAKVDQRGDEDGTALSVAAARVGHLGIVQQLVEAGADVDNATNPSNRHLPFAEACHWDHLHGIDYLVERGADVELRGRMHWLMGRDTLLIAAVRWGRFGVCERLLNSGADAEFSDSSKTTAMDWARGECRSAIPKVVTRAYRSQRKTVSK